MHIPAADIVIFYVISPAFSESHKQKNRLRLFSSPSPQSLMSHIAIVFSQSMKVFVNSFSKTVLCSLVCFTLQTALSLVCFTKWINPKTSRPVLLWFYIHLAEIWNGIRISTASYPKADTAMMVFDVMSNTLTILSYAMLFARLCLIKWNPKSVLLSKKWRRNVIANTNRVFMFMPNPFSAIPELL